MSDIKIIQLPIGPMDNFAYFLISESRNEMLVVDPGWEGPQLIQKIKSLGATPVGILLTHGHYDHINAVPDIQAAYPNLPVYFSKDEHPMFLPKCDNLTFITGGDQLDLLGITITCIATPGHSPGCISFYLKPILITGDALFIQGCGRCDLPGSNPKDMYISLFERIKPLPGDTVIYAGHNYGDTPSALLDEVLKTNTVFKAANEGQFLSRFM